MVAFDKLKPLAKRLATNVCELSFTCDCDPCWEGQFCDFSPNKCDSSPCQLGGTCNSRGPGTCAYDCNCYRGTTSVHCETDIPECDSQPCLNGGTCEEPKPMPYGNPPFDMWYCICDCGWTGIICEIDIDECASSPCQNGGTCIQVVPPNCEEPFECYCPRGFKNDPEFCETDIDECENTPCHSDLDRKQFEFYSKSKKLQYINMYKILISISFNHGLSFSR